MLFDAELFRNFELPSDFSGGVQFQYLLRRVLIGFTMPWSKPTAPRPEAANLAAKAQPAATIVTAKHPRRWRYEPAEYVPNEEADAKAKRFLDRMMRPPSMD